MPVLDVIEQLQRYGDAVAESVEPVRPADVGSVTVESILRPRRPRWQPMLAAAAAIALVAGGFWFLVDRSNTSPPAGPSPTSGPPATGNTSATTAPKNDAGPHAAVELLDAGPLEPRDGSALAWTGSELVVWGGAIEPVNRGLTGPDRQFTDGAAYNPSTHTWRTMAAGPLPSSLSTPVAVSTGDAVVIARGTSVARWDPDRNTWKQLDDAPAAVSDLAFVGPQHVVSVSANAVLDPTTGGWQPLPTPPLSLGRPVAALSDDGLIVVGQRSFSAPGAIALDLDTRTWRELPDPPNLNPAALSADRDGHRAMFVDYEMHVAAFGGGAWEALDPIPARFYEGSPQLAVVPPAFIVTTTTAVVVRSGDLWVPLPKGALDFWGSGSTVVPAGEGRDAGSLFVFGMTSTGENRLAWVDPAQLAAEARTLQVGEMTLRIPDGMRLVHSDYVDKDGQQMVLVTLETPTGNCDVTSTYDGGAGGGTHPWSAYASGLTWTARATTSDAVRVVCGADPDTAKRIVDATSVPLSTPGE
jgi:hypothetical protein